MSRAGKGEVDALAEKVHDHSVRPLEGVRLTLGELLEDLDRMGTEHAIHRDNEWMEGLTTGFTDGLALAQLSIFGGLENTGGLAGDDRGAIKIDNTHIDDELKTTSN